MGAVNRRDILPLQTLQGDLDDLGYTIFWNFIPPKMVEQGIQALHRAEECCASIRFKNGVSNSEGTVHHLLYQAPVFREILAEFETLDRYLSDFFQGNYILNSYGGNLLAGMKSYANNIHRDIRTFSGKIPLMLNSIVMLDDFTVDNGATWILPRGHRLEEKPSPEYFIEHATQAEAPAGSVLLFNSNLWHAAGKNKTDQLRRSLTPMFSKPFMKPQFDYVKAKPKGIKALPPYLRQLAGYNSRVPATLDQWYQPPSKRFYQPDQG